MASEDGSLSEEEGSNGCCLSPAVYVSPGVGEHGGCAKLFIFNLARTVRDADLEPLFAQFDPVYALVAVGKKGTSRRFGFAKFHTQEAAQAALDALRGTLLHGKEMDLKFAVADDPDPGNGVLAKSRAKMRASAVNDMTRLAALPPPTDGTRTDASAEQPQYCTPTLPGWPARPSVPPYCMQAQTAQSLVMHASLPLPSPVTAPNSLPAPSMAAQFMKGYAVPAAMPDYQRPSPSLRGAPAAAPPFHQHEPLPLQHMLVVAGMPGLHHASITQLVWSFQPLSISTGIDLAGYEQTSVVFAELQQAQAAQDAIRRCAAEAGSGLVTSIVTIPLQHPRPRSALPAMEAQAAYATLMPAGMQPPAPKATLPGLPPLSQAQHCHAGEALAAGQLPPPTVQQQREAVTMRPLYAGPRPPHIRPPGYPYIWPPPPNQWPPQSDPVAGPPGPPAAFPSPPFQHLSGQEPDLATEVHHTQQQRAAPPRYAHLGCALPEALEAPASPRRLNPAAAPFMPTNLGHAAAAAAAAPSAHHRPPACRTSAPTVAMPPVIHATFSGVVAALADRPHLPSQERLHQEAAPTGAAPLVGAGSADYVSGTEDEGDAAPDPREVYAAVNGQNLNACFVTRALMRQLIPVELVLKATAVGDPEATPSVLAGAVVRVLIDKTYKLRQIQSTRIKRESGRLMLVLHDVSNPIPAEHISNTNPFSPAAVLSPSAMEVELLELQARMAHRGRRLYRHEVAATAWRIQFAEYWQREQGSKTGDDLRLATAQLRGMLADKDEIKWRRRAIIGLDLSRETAMICSAFRLPWPAAASWMAQCSPSGKAAPVAAASTPLSAGRSSVAEEDASKATEFEVLGPANPAPLPNGGNVRRSWMHGADKPAQHDRCMAAARDSMLPGQSAISAAQGLFAPAPDAASDEFGVASSLFEQLAEEEDHMLTDASAFGCDAGAEGAPLPDFFNTALTLKPPPGDSPASSAGHKGGHTSGTENSASHCSSPSRAASKMVTAATAAARPVMISSPRIAAHISRQGPGRA